MEEIIVWYYPPTGRPEGIPERPDTTYTDVFNPKKPMYGADASWLDYNHFIMPFPPEGRLKLPDHLLFVVKKYKEVLFDFFSIDTSYKVLSSELLNFFKKNGFTDGYEIAKSTIVNTKGLEISKKLYYIIRIGVFNDDMLNFENNDKIEANNLKGQYLYKKIVIKKGVKQKVFFLKKVTYCNSILLSKELEDEVLKKFYAPQLFSIEDYSSEFNEKKW